MEAGLPGTFWGILGALGLTMLAGLLGMGIMHRGSLCTRVVWECGACAVALGYGLLSSLAYALGLCGALSAQSVCLLVLCCALAVAATRYRQRRAGSRGQPGPDQEGGSDAPCAPSSDASGRSDRERRSIPRWGIALSAVAAPFLLALLPLCLTPPVDYDGLAYHLAAPKRWLELGAIRHLPTQINTEWPMGFEMLFLLLLPTAGPLACKPLVWLVTLLTAAATYGLGARVANRTVGAVAAALLALYLSPENINTTSIEIPLAYFTVCSALALAGWRQTQNGARRRAWFCLAVFLAGMACCVKLNGLLCASILAGVVFCLTPSPQTPLRRLKTPALFLLGAILCAFPWYLRTWIDTGNPIYPFLYGLLGGQDWNGHAGQVLTLYFRIFNLPGTTVGERLAVWHRHLLRLTAATLVGTAVPSPSWVRGMLAASGVFVLAQLAASDQSRFCLPAAPFVALGVAWWIVRLAGRWPPLGWCLVVIAAVTTLPGALRLGANAAPSVFRLTPSGRSEYPESYAAYGWANLHLPRDARVLMGMTACPYFLQRDAYWSDAIMQQQIRYANLTTFEAGLRHYRIGYLMLDRSADQIPTLQFEVRAGWRAAEWRCLEEEAARSTLLWQDRHVAIYRLPFPLSLKPSRQNHPR